MKKKTNKKHVRFVKRCVQRGGAEDGEGARGYFNAQDCSSFYRRRLSFHRLNSGNYAVGLLYFPVESQNADIRYDDGFEALKRW